MATKIDIISGFLGAGKTTLIKKLLKEAFGDEQVVLIENEFGEIGIACCAFFSSTISVRLMMIAPAYSTWLLKNSPKFLIYILHFFASTTVV